MAEVEHRKASIVADIFHWIKESRQSVMIKQISSMDSCGATKEDGYVCITSFLEVKILFLSADSFSSVLLIRPWQANDDQADDDFQKF